MFKLTKFGKDWKTNMRTVFCVKSLIAVAICVLAMSADVRAGAVLTVNSTIAGNFCDDRLSLAEALSIARGETLRFYTDGEKNQISGATWIPSPLPPTCATFGWQPVNGVGANFADDIVFSNDPSILSGAFILGKNDDINGLKPNGVKVILDGAAVGGVNSGLTIEVDSGSQVRNLEIRNYTANGIFSQALNGAKFEGLTLHHNNASGMSFGFSTGNTNKNSRNVTIGGTEPQHRNVIHSNGDHGIYIIAATGFDRFPDQGITILNNLIGTSDGVTDNGNGQFGILLQDVFGVTVGDTGGTTRNVISGNGNDGIKIFGPFAVSNKIINNFIGTDISGAVPLGNDWSGVGLTDGAGLNVDFVTSSPNRVGMPGAPNVISGNSWGVFIGYGNASKNIVQANYIGTNLGGNTDVGNANEGVYLGNTSFDNLIGGTAANESNVIAFNNRNGIYQDDGARNAFRRNRIFSNELLGIDIVPAAGVNSNDALDADSGPNGLLNYPVITYVLQLSMSVAIEGTYHSAPNQTYTLEFFGNSAADGSGFGEGRNFIGSTQVATDASGNATFNVNFASSQSNTSQFVTATATDSVSNTSEFSGARSICADMRLNPTSVLAPVAGLTSSFTYVQSNGCGTPSATSSSWITVNSVLAGTVNFTVQSNNGPGRNGQISVNYNNGSGGQSTAIFTVGQDNGCVYALQPASANFSAEGGNASFSVISGPGCTWGAISASSWITRSAMGGTGSGFVPYSVSANTTGSPRTGQIGVANQVFTVNQAAAVPVRKPVSDFDGDGKTDISIFRPSNGQWWLNRSAQGVIVHTFGNSSDRLASADFTGDQKEDVAIWRPSTGEWFVLRSENSTFYSFPFGANGDIPVPGDYDADGKADAAVFRPSNSTWYIQQSGGGVAITTFGANGDRPVPADYDGDGRTDIAIFRPSNGQWWLNRSTAGVLAVTFGNSSDKQVPGDYTGDGKADVAVWRPVTGEWFVLRSENLTYFASQFGSNGDVPAPGDYDGDGRFDFTVFRPSNSTWYVQRSTAGLLIQSFGAAGDLPVPSSKIP